MKSVMSGVLGMIFMLGMVGVAQAQIDLNLPGLDVEIDGDNVSVDTGDVDANVSDTSSAVEISNGDAQIDVSDSGVDIVTPDTAVQVSNTGSVEVATDGADIAVSESDTAVLVDAGLSVQLDEGSVNVKTAEMLLEIDEDDATLIQTDSDVRAYGRITTNSNPEVAAVSVNTDNVSVVYQDEGNLFGIFPISYKTSVVVNDEGEVSVESPWYSFMVFGTHSAVVETSVAAEITAGSVEIENESLRRAQYIDVVADAVRVHVGDSTVQVETEGVSVDTDAEGTDIEVRGSDGEYIRITEDVVNISL